MEMDPIYEMNAYYAYDLMNYDAIGTIISLKKPTLILQGSNDWIVSEDIDYRRYRARLRNRYYVDMKVYEGLNHMFMPSEATNILEAIAEYDTPADIPAQVFDDIAAWIEAN